MKNFQKQVCILECKNEELEQYGRRYCFRIEGVPSAENGGSGDVLGKVGSLVVESGCEMPGVVVGGAHWVGRGCRG